ncbi:hypothetical protein [Bradyrhizobium sp. 613_E4_N2_2]|uniref:hypothetical protein n=1 Tax=unclassified Bradyrhizobium TaxID=2631580 RepID=UPI003F89CDEF
MAESFGNSFTVVQLTGDDAKTHIWIALAKPSQALTLILAAVPEGWAAEVLNIARQLSSSGCLLNLGPEDVYKLT